MTLINREAFFKNFSNAEELAKEAIDVFHETLPGMILDIEKALVDRNPKHLQTAAHTLKGSVAIFHADSIVKLAGDLERIGRQSETEGASIVLATLRTELEHLSKFLHHLKDELKAVKPAHRN